MIEQLDAYGLWLAAVVAGLTALGWLCKKAYKGVTSAYKGGRALVRRIDALADIAEYQLNNNGGGSMLDKIERSERATDHLTGTVTELAGVVDRLDAKVDSLGDTFESHLATQAEANREMWPAVRAVAEARPPATDN